VEANNLESSAHRSMATHLPPTKNAHAPPTYQLINCVSGETLTAAENSKIKEIQNWQRICGKVKKVKCMVYN